VDSNLVNGVTYYYTIKAFDINYNAFNATTLKGESPIILEGAGKTKAVVPRSITSNYVAGTSNIEFVSGNIDTSAIKMEVVQLLDTLVQEIVNDTFTLTFGLADSSIVNDTLPAYNYVITNKAGDTIAVDKVALSNVWKFKDDAPAEVEVISNVVENCNAYKGFVFKINEYELDRTNWNNFSNDTTFTVRDVVCSTGTYVDSILAIEVAGQGWQFQHASTKYMLTWHETVATATTIIGVDTLFAGDTALTVTILDVDNNIEIPYSSTDVEDNWHFNFANGQLPSAYKQYLKATSSAVAKTGLYFSNLKLSFNKTGRANPMVWASRPKDGDIWMISIYPKDATLTWKRPPLNSSYTFTLTASSFTELADSILDNIKVVPNPYVVRSELDLDYNYRRILFTNLPQVCTIRVYTLAGELIKTIEHNTEYYVYSGSDSTIVQDNTNGYAEWDVLTQNDQIPAPGIYIYHVSAPGNVTKIGKFAIIK